MPTLVIYGNEKLKVIKKDGEKYIDVYDIDVIIHKSGTDLKIIKSPDEVTK